METRTDYIPPGEAGTLPRLFQARVRRTPEAIAYRQFDAGQGLWRECSWAAASAAVERWRAALSREGLKPGDVVAIMLPNSGEWLTFDQAALSLGLVVVPLYTSDRADNLAYILEDSGASVLILQQVETWRGIEQGGQALKRLQRVIVTQAAGPMDSRGRVMGLDQWLERGGDGGAEAIAANGHDLASIVYTSGSTGRPKGVRLSHLNMLENAWAGLQRIPIYPDDLFLSFLPLSHTLERTIGYYVPVMAGATVAYARSVNDLPEDLAHHRPTALVSVPRIYERVYGRILQGLKEKSPTARELFHQAVAVGWHRYQREQGLTSWHPRELSWPLLRALVAGKVTRRLGGRLRVAISGGAPLSPEISRLFLALGVPVLEGYGLTESSPVIAVNTLKDNRPGSVGKPLPGVEVRIGEQDELQVRGPNIMAGYWNNPAADRQALTRDGWLRTGDKARLDPEGRITITGRIKEIIVLANGEKVPPIEVEMAIANDPMFEQVMVVGEGRPYLVALVVLNEAIWREVAAEHGLPARMDAASTSPEVEAWLLERIGDLLHRFPGYVQVRRLRILPEPWTVDNAMLTPTLKLKRNSILKCFQDDLEALYEGHHSPRQAPRLAHSR
ncbi:long-chain fatty acid--CoA ligase [Ectothiorhodospira shaposhnikovii]|uniref:AMP-dependent synthetase/ligase n=1 Tax=Ectothiorhodospira shaposhnikovii TaxID=1054 RepID=UPI001905EEFB|nr:AMP-dependent synthetase/ligase [Ectothiorhodospira shaposhnikovii]MBK1671712.1 long-chain fatty acid--CoA ligase [Ectothiorhodospira shaposhnikovii]